MLLRGWALMAQGAESAKEEALAQMRQGFTDLLATGAGIRETYYRALLAEVAWSRGDSDTGQQLVAEACAVVQRTEERYWEAELYRLQGALGGQGAERPQWEGSRSVLAPGPRGGAPAARQIAGITRGDESGPAVAAAGQAARSARSVGSDL